MIPKIIHQIWLGNREIPQEFVQFTNKWREMYTGFQYVLWTDAAVVPYRLKNIYDIADTLSAKSDILRFCVIREFGGIYIDTDTEPLKTMDFLDDIDFFAGYQIPTEINGALYGAIKNNEFVCELIDRLEPYVTQKVKELGNDWNMYSHIFTGPVYITHIASKFLSKESYKFFEPKYFYPYWCKEMYRRYENFKETSPDAYSVHHWAHSWKDY